MAIKKISREWIPEYGAYREKFIADTEADIAALPKSDTGSVAVVIENGDIYVVNAAGEWAEFDAEG